MESRMTGDPGSQAVRKEIVEANGIQLYCEVRGSGPSVLFISGATGDAGHFERVAELLANEFTVVTYDRRGNSRSPRPQGWTTTTMDEQADDAAGLLNVLELAPAAVFGNSGGAIIALNLLLRYPQVVRGAILHEPWLVSLLAHPEEVMAVLQPAIESGMARGGPRGAVDAFLRAVGVDVDSLDPALRERMLNNGETLFGIEFGAFVNYQPDPATLAVVQRPVQVMAGTESAPYFTEVVNRLATRLHVEPGIMPGGHTPHNDRPEAVATEIRPFLRQVSSASR
jgi:pimeloyl-ACP methyl ester carboxylesterase